MLSVVRDSAWQETVPVHIPWYREGDSRNVSIVPLYHIFDLRLLPLWQMSIVISMRIAQDEPFPTLSESAKLLKPGFTLIYPDRVSVNCHPMDRGFSSMLS